MPRKTVLVVEDNPLLRQDTAFMLEEGGFEVFSLDSADDAFAYLVEQEGQVAAVFTDVELDSAMDGFELARAIALSWPGIMVLVTSGRRTVPSDFPSSVRFFPKPWLPHDVLTAIGDAANFR